MSRVPIYHFYGGPIMSDIRHRRGFLGENRVLTNRHYEALRAGGVVGLNMPVVNMEDIQLLYAEVAESDGRFRFAFTPTSIASSMTQGESISIALCLGPHRAGDEPEVFHTYLALGAVMFSFGHNRRNLYADGCGEPEGGGLSLLGLAVTRKCVELGIILDATHLSERGFWDLMKQTDAMVVATHSNSYTLCDHPRNLKDDQIRAIAERGGLIGINFFPSFVKRSNPTVEDVLDHIDYMVRLAGEEHVALGPDFQDFANEVVVPLLNRADPTGSLYTDGYTYPAGVETVAKEQNVVDGMRRRGYSEERIQKICYGNWLRVLKQHEPTRTAALARHFA